MPSPVAPPKSAPLTWQADGLPLVVAAVGTALVVSAGTERYQALSAAGAAIAAFGLLWAWFLVLPRWLAFAFWPGAAVFGRALAGVLIGLFALATLLTALGEGEFLGNGLGVLGSGLFVLTLATAMIGSAVRLVRRGSSRR